MPYIPAYQCDLARFYLLWERLRGRRYGWVVHHGEQVLGTLDGFPVGQPARTHLDAVPWAAKVTGIPADQWIRQPAHSSAHHAHQEGEPCR